MERFRKRKYARSAFTLLEVMLVLALMAIIAGMAWSNLQIPLAQQRLKSAVDNVRTAWCQARVDAMKSGQTYVFRYSVHGSRYHICLSGDSTSLDANSSATKSAGANNDSSNDDPLPPPVSGRLPEGIRFLRGDAEGELASLPDAPEKAGDDPGEGWSDPISFYADGTTSDAQIILARNKHSAVRLLLRGITGTATIDDGQAKTEMEGEP